jgi:RNA polymerase sigma-70 factor (ECF subfamily)
VVVAAASVARLSLDADSRRWLDELDPASARREDAVARLHALLLSAARFEVRRRAAGFGHLRGDDLDDIAMQSAHDALMAVLRKLGDYRGASRFTTWAYKFALLETAVAVRRRAWQGREVVLAPDAWSAVEHGGLSTAARAETAETLARITTAIGTRLTPHQRAVLLAVAVDGVPIDVLAERLGATRGALYKTLHDARRKLRACLDEGDDR